MSTSDTLPTKIVSVPHLGGTKISYHLTKPIVGSKPTLILINAFTTTATFFRPQLTDTALLDEMNLVAMEPLGHGNSSTVSPSWTFWDSAAAFLQAMDALGVRKAYVLGSSQGGWMAVRMALLAPTRVTGIISINSHMGAADAHMLELGCLDFTPGLTENIKAFAKADPEFKLPEDMIPSFAPLSLGPSPSDADMSLFVSSANKVYAGDSGRQKIRAAIIALLSRDSLHLRLDAVVAPVLWIRGEEDKVFTIKAAEEDVARFVNAKVEVETVQGGYHAPSWTHADEVNRLVLGFVKKNGGKVDARALREAVGMVDI